MRSTSPGSWRSSARGIRTAGDPRQLRGGTAPGGGDDRRLGRRGRARPDAHRPGRTTRPRRDAARRVRRPASRHHEAIAEAELDIDYGRSPIVMGDAHPALGPGQRLPDTIEVRLASGDERGLHELTHRAGHTALLIGGASSRDDDLARLADAMRARSDAAIRRSDGRAHDAIRRSARVGIAGAGRQPTQLGIGDGDAAGRPARRSRRPPRRPRPCRGARRLSVAAGVGATSA